MRAARVAGIDPGHAQDRMQMRVIVRRAGTRIARKNWVLNVILRIASWE